MLTDTIKSAIRSQILPRGQRDVVKFRDRPLVVAGMFRTANGIGRAAIGCYHALQDEGLDPIAVDLSEGFNQIDHESPITLSQMPRDKRGTAIIYANAPEIQRALSILKLRRWHKWRIIGSWAWELPKVPTAWRRQTKFLSEIWAPSTFVAHAFESGLNVPVKRVPHYFRRPTTQRGASEKKIAPPESFQIVTMADGRSSFHRKNVLGAVDIFQAAFADIDTVRLVVKSRNLTLFPAYHDALLKKLSGDPRITIIDANMTETEIQSLLSNSDVLLSPHRAEGFGIPLAEAMMTGTVVVATGWSGNTDFMTEQNSVCLPYTLEPLKDPSGVYQAQESTWANVDIEASAKALRALHADRGRLKTLAQNAGKDMQIYMDSSHYSQALGLSPTNQV